MQQRIDTKSFNVERHMWNALNTQDPAQWVEIESVTEDAHHMQEESQSVVSMDANSCKETLRCTTMKIP